MRVVFGIVLSGFIVNCFAGERQPEMPTGCVSENVAFMRGFYDLRTKGPNQLFMIYNRSPMNVWLDHAIEHTGASAGWASMLKPKRWSALMISEPLFRLSCSYFDKKFGQHRLNCMKVVRICHMRSVDIEKTRLRNSNFWAAENLTLPKLQEHLKQRKIILNP